ncbi:transposase [Ktedonobacteria bacterium brp13]|nr:transposase [Ktedonobacteria bacterium brp13]
MLVDEACGQSPCFFLSLFYHILTHYLRQSVLVKIDQWFPSSKTCYECKQVVEDLPLDVREWTCPACGAWHERDINAARNILAEGLSVSACGGSVRPVRVNARQATPQ